MSGEQPIDLSFQSTEGELSDIEDPDSSSQSSNSASFPITNVAPPTFGSTRSTVVLSSPTLSRSTVVTQADTFSIKIDQSGQSTTIIFIFQFNPTRVTRVVIPCQVVQVLFCMSEELSPQVSFYSTKGDLSDIEDQAAVFSEFLFYNVSNQQRFKTNSRFIVSFGCLPSPTALFRSAIMTTFRYAPTKSMSPPSPNQSMPRTEQIVQFFPMSEENN
jgi:hypothetical protein